MMSTETVVLKFGASPDIARAVEDCCIEWQIASTNNKSNFIGQMYVESQGFTRVRENLNYSVDGLLKNFGRHRISEADAKLYGRSEAHAANVREIANRIYGGKWGRDNLGNVLPTDGFDFSGKGFIQITGRDNVERYSRQRYGDDRVVKNPALLLYLPDSVAVAGWYWRDKRLSLYADKNDVLAVSRGVNLGNPLSQGTPNHLQERREATQRALAYFEELKR